MAVNIKSTTGYFFLDSWVIANIIQLATLEYCERFLNLNNDPKGRQYDQMTQAARSVTANIAEGLSRQTSVETEMKLLDVARASLSELQGDYFMAILHRNNTPWSDRDPRAVAVAAVNFDRPTYTDDLLHNAGQHILVQKQKLCTWTNEQSDVTTFANCMLILCKRLIQMLQKLIEKKLADFKEKGGFAENMTQTRLEAIKQQSTAESAPTCPKCGKQMRRRMAKRGTNQGNEFWSCTDYPNCNGTRNISDTRYPPLAPPPQKKPPETPPNNDKYTPQHIPPPHHTHNNNDYEREWSVGAVRLGHDID